MAQRLLGREYRHLWLPRLLDCGHDFSISPLGTVRGMSSSLSTGPVSSTDCLPRPREVFVRAWLAHMSLFRRIALRIKALRGVARDLGMTTAEYAVGTIAAVAFAGVLFKVVSSPAVRSALTALVARALKAPF